MKCRSEKLLPDPSSHALSVTQHDLKKNSHQRVGGKFKPQDPVKRILVSVHIS